MDCHSVLTRKSKFDINNFYLHF